MSTQYNSTAAAFTDKLHQENYEFACSGVPFQAMLHPVECATSQTSIEELYIRNTQLSNSYDPRLYDLGEFQLSTVGMQSGVTTIGELWATYDIEFFKPKLNLGPQDSSLHAIFTTTSGSNPFSGAAINMYVAPGSTIQPVWVSSSVLQLGFLTPGIYIVILAGWGNNTTVAIPTISITGATAIICLIMMLIH
jgi:hypothetical protein